MRPTLMQCLGLTAAALLPCAAMAGFITPGIDPNEGPPPSPYLSAPIQGTCSTGLTSAVQPQCRDTFLPFSLATAQEEFDALARISNFVAPTFNDRWIPFYGLASEQFGAGGGLISADYDPTDPTLQRVRVAFLQELVNPFLLSFGNYYGSFLYYFDGSEPIEAGTVITFDATTLYNWGPNAMPPLSLASVHVNMPEPGTLLLGGLAVLAMTGLAIRRRR